MDQFHHYIHCEKYYANQKLRLAYNSMSFSHCQEMRKLQLKN